MTALVRYKAPDEDHPLAASLIVWQEKRFIVIRVLYHYRTTGNMSGRRSAVRDHLLLTDPNRFGPGCEQAPLAIGPMKPRSNRQDSGFTQQH
jgi:hypothetical protein